MNINVSTKIAIAFIAVGTTYFGVSLSKKLAMAEPNRSRNVSAEVFEDDTDSDGTIDHTLKRLARGGKTLFDERAHLLSNGIWSTSRTYYVNGKIQLTEMDQNGNGERNHIIVYGTSLRQFEVFVITNHIIVPVESVVLDDLHKQSEYFHDFFQATKAGKGSDR